MKHMKKYSREDSIKTIAKELGFDLVGITSAEPFFRGEQESIKRIKDGFMNGLNWYTEERVRKANRPRLLLNDAKSVISLGLNYFSEPTTEKPATPSGRIARYAWGDDYHKVIKKKLSEFCSRLDCLVPENVESRFFVDDGPMNDRAAAERSGIGWYGKNTNILTSSHGSWIFLAQIITNLELTADIPLKKTCGSCVRCIDECPTSAIVAPFVIDNTKCISYLTIELKGSIPIEMRPLIGDWVFGCDICQDVCPVNRKANYSSEPAFQQRHDFSAPDLLPLLELSEEDFRDRFQSSPIKRTKRVGLQRNVCVALGNIGDRQAIPSLGRALGSADSSVVRSHAAWALGQIGGLQSKRYLLQAKDDETDKEVVDEIKLAIIASRD